MSEELVYKRAQGIWPQAVSGFCPGCLHGAAHKIVAEVLEEMGQTLNTTLVVGIGCCSLSPGFVAYDMICAAHGRACAVASAYKRNEPGRIVFSYQGDGDLASIGIAETMMAANRGENFTVIFINNGTYGMTGGQMAPTSLIGQKTTTSPYGRKAEEHGYPIHMCEILSQLPAPSYIARVTTISVKERDNAKKAVRKAFQNQLDGKGFSFVEFVSNCPTNWGMQPLDTIEHIKANVLPEFPLGTFRDK